MECKFCHAQMDEETTVCPVCGQAQDEEIPETVTEPEEEAVLSEETAAPEEVQALPEEPAEAPKKKKTGMIIGIIAGCLAVAAIAVALVLLLRPKTPEGMGTTDISAKAVYTVEAADLAKNADYVVAQMGDKTLTVSQLQVFYWMEYYNFMSSYGSSAIYFGLDSTKPLSEQQSSMEEGKTWEQYFLKPRSTAGASSRVWPSKRKRTTLY